MGCFGSKPAATGGRKAERADQRDKLFMPPKWKSDEPMTQAQLEKKREEFWDTAPHYGGDRVIWDALKAAATTDIETAKLITESAGIIVGPPNMTVCYDERGAKYELPPFVLSAPTNLARGDVQPGFQAGSSTAAELMSH